MFRIAATSSRCSSCATPLAEKVEASSKRSIISRRNTEVMFRIAATSSRKHLHPRLHSISSLAETVGKTPSGNVHNYSSLAPAEQRLAGQVAIITGGASGIGARTARVFTQHGARVVIADVQADKGENLAKDLGPKAQFVYCDVRKEDDIIKAWESAYALENRLDVVFNNAGIPGAICPLTELPIAEFDATMGVNVRGMVLGIKHAARLMKPAGKGSIVCTSSAAGLSAGLFPFSYSLSKASIVAMVKCAAAELRRFGIRVNSISPDLVSTPMGVDVVQATYDSTGKDGTALNVTIEGLNEMIKKRSLIPGRHLTDHDVANAALFLASDTGGYITGHNLAVDGGRADLKLVDPEIHSWATTYQPMFNVGGKRGLT